MPIVRTFVPVRRRRGADDDRVRSSLYNAVGAVGWVSLCLGAGWFFGNIPIVKNNFSLVTIGIVFVSVLPMLFELINHSRRSGSTG